MSAKFAMKVLRFIEFRNVTYGSLDFGYIYIYIYIYLVMFYVSLQCFSL